MSTILKIKFDWVQKGNTVLVYSDHARFFRESLLFTGDDKVITPHQAIKFAKETMTIDLRMLSEEDRAFVKDILLKNNVIQERIIC